MNAKQIVRTADRKGRVALPGFADATVIIEKVDETEYRVRKAAVVPVKDLQFHEEEGPVKLSAKDAATVLSALEDPPVPNAAARKAAKRFRRHHE
jgi:hypothetical protein